jgi:hypothetical protein
VVVSGKGVNPNGIYPARDGSMLMVGFKAAEEARGIYSVNKKGRRNGVGQTDRTFRRSLSDERRDHPGNRLELRIALQLDGEGGMKTLTSNFKGLADLCAYRNGKGLMVVVPDLAKSEVRLIKLNR